MRERLEFLLAATLLKALTWMPRPVAKLVTQLIGFLGYCFAGRLRQIASYNLSLALPHLSGSEHRRIVKGVFRNLARLLAEFSQFPKFTLKGIDRIVVYDGFENYAEAKKRGKGILIMSAHFGAWELASFAHSVYGYPLKFLVRPLDNPRVDALIMRYRQLAGNVGIDKRNSMREVLRALRQNEAVGILIDQNASREEGVFANFFGIPASTTAGLATLAMRTGAAVVPGLLIWDEQIKKHRLRFEPPVVLVDTGNFQADVIGNTARFNRILEEKIRMHPDQWLWVHRRWKTRPEGEPALYN
ncbi:MAG: lysophospholipid acyltransferase family protein [Acidobacteriia bacterium]|nr:lysophospholipid acyltransferase family protein [Terriglobia bacterium]